LPITIAKKTIFHVHRRQAADWGVREGIGDRHEHAEYFVSIIGHDDGDYHITITGPEGTHVNRKFSSTEDHEMVRNIVEWSIPRNVPARERVLCDICVQQGYYWVSMRETPGGCTYV
jgi:hypothetical protein